MMFGFSTVTHAKFSEVLLMVIVESALVFIKRCCRASLTLANVIWFKVPIGVMTTFLSLSISVKVTIGFKEMQHIKRDYDLEIQKNTLQAEQKLKLIYLYLVLGFLTQEQECNHQGAGQQT